MADNVKMDIDDNIAIVSMDNPPVNSLSTAVLNDLNTVLDEVEENDAKGVIITGKGEAFVAGADISEMKGMDPDQAERFSRKGHEVFNRIENFTFPTIAAVNGYALGGGMELAMSADLIVASENALFGQPETGLGVIPGFGGTQRLPRIVGKAQAKELIFTGKKFKPDRAREMGLVNHVTGPEELMEKAKNIAREMAQNAPMAVRFAKEAIEEGDELTMDEALKVEREKFKQCFETEDQMEGMDAFQNKREPDFKGK